MRAKENEGGGWRLWTFATLATKAVLSMASSSDSDDVTATAPEMMTMMPKRE